MRILAGVPMRPLPALLLSPRAVSAAVALALAPGCYPEIDLSGIDKGTVGGDDTGVTSDDTGGGDDTGQVEDCRSWTDADGDGFGDPETRTTTPCDQVPEGNVDNGDDCDDTSDVVFPGAPERCDALDNDCDAEIDEDINYDWYGDADGDGYGDATAYVETCAPDEGYVADATDCDDTRADTHPDADELCDDYDNDCDGTLDEDAIDPDAWYADTDGDGYGDASDVAFACDPMEGRVADFDDCDDTRAAVNPAAQEVCNELDDDCDGNVDDDDLSLDTSTTLPWYADSDVDGFGDAGVVTWACAQPSGTVTDDTDCNDADVAINPAALEICNGIDDDCDTLTDDADDSLDLSTGTTFYTDADADGYGDAAATVVACVQPSGTVSDATDCDDATFAVNPAAQEVCDDVDNDCDGDIDDDDSSLDAATGETWYADADGDGFGDATSTTQACDAPSGFTDNGADCDDADASDGVDLDGDGDPNCADDDMDGDGLRNDWDADEEDPSIARGPTGGLGTEGTLSLSSDDTQDEWTLAAAAVVAGATSVSVDDASIFASGDEFLILSQQGADAGTYEFAFVSSVDTSSNTLTVEPPLTNSYAAASTVLVQRVPHYTTVTISGELDASDWSAGSGGGVIVFRATGVVTISGEVTTRGRGFAGGDGVTGNSSAGEQGESWSGAGSRGVATANDGGGGSYPLAADGCDSGGGGGYAAAGGDGYGLYCSRAEWWGCAAFGYAQTVDGGDSYGDSALSSWFLGSGGGAGAPDSESDGNDSRNETGDGGDGGGIIAIYSASRITVSGEINAEGRDGQDADTYGGESGGGGGGAGGTILLVAPTLTLNGPVSAIGGDGGTGESYAYNGRYSASCGVAGDGADGRVRLEYTTITGASSVDPSAGSTGSYVD